MVGNGGSARKAYLDTTDLAITPDDDYLVAGYRLRMMAAPGTRRLAAAIRTTPGSRRRVSYAMSTPAEAKLSRERPRPFSAELVKQLEEIARLRAEAR